MLDFILKLAGWRRMPETVLAPILCPSTREIYRKRQDRSADVAADLYASQGGVVLR